MDILEEHKKKGEIALEKTEALLEKEFFTGDRGACNEIYNKAMLIIKNFSRRAEAKVLETNMLDRVEKERFCYLWTTDGIELEDKNGKKYYFMLETSLIDCFSKFIADFPSDIKCNFLLNINADLLALKSKEITLIISPYEIKARKGEEEESIDTEEIKDVKDIVNYLEEHLRFNMKFG